MRRGSEEELYLKGSNGEQVKTTLRLGPDPGDETRAFVSFWVGSDSWGTVQLASVRRWASDGALEFRRGAERAVGLIIPQEEVERLFAALSEAQEPSEAKTRRPGPRLRLSSLSSFAERLCSDYAA